MRIGLHAVRIVLGAVLLGVCPVRAPAEPGRPTGKAVVVELGKAFRLNKGDSARVKGTMTSLRITGFVNSPCPKGAMCVWSGLAVLHEWVVDGKVVQQKAKDAPYDVDVKDSDYRTYAVLIVDAPERECSAMDPLSRPECLRSLARRRENPGLCLKISDERTRGFCLEDLAEALNKDELCRDVAVPTQKCLYLKAKAAGDLAACDDVVTMPWRDRCFKELSKEGGGGPHSCSELPPEPARLCREFAAGAGK